jgi:hypothetical protein
MHEAPVPYPAPKKKKNNSDKKQQLYSYIATTKTLKTSNARTKLTLKLLL